MTTATRRRSALGVAVVAAALAVSDLALVRSGWSPLNRLDHTVLRDLNDYIAPRRLQTLFWKAVTDAGAPFVWNTLATIAVIWFVVRRMYRPAGFVAATMIGTGVINSTTKNLVGRPRPVVASPVTYAHGASFPSGHAITSLVAVGVVLVLGWPLLTRFRAVAVVAGVLVAAAIGTSRLVLGVHYVSDVAGGWLLGTAWLALMVAVFAPSIVTAEAEPQTETVRADGNA